MGSTSFSDLGIGGQYPEDKCSWTAQARVQTTSGGTMGIRDLAVYERWLRGLRVLGGDPLCQLRAVSALAVNSARARR